ncbi:MULTISPECIES: caspase family protein [unclassified Mesorhizobium]|uniref:caspase family protein n=1 Tax=unclassified Mesorhizobium TaxID=325217 RepID=UPI000ACE56FD|nr:MULTISPECIES: caspase family protein [unclassified Mesorhizobium]MBN9254559.1 caspase family protein [Mesorhizobium sp.]
MHSESRPAWGRTIFLISLLCWTICLPANAWSGPKGLSGGCLRGWYAWNQRDGYGTFAAGKKGCSYNWEQSDASASASRALSECNRTYGRCSIISRKRPSARKLAKDSCLYDATIDSDKKIDACRSFLSMNGLAKADQLSAHSELAYLLGMKNDGAGVVAEETEYLKIDPDDTWSMQKGSHYSQRGKGYLYLDRYDEAIADFDRAIAIGVTDSTVYRDRGIAWSAKGDSNKARSDYDEAIRLDPNSTLAYLHRAEASRDQGDFDKALDDYNRVIGLDPKLAAAYSERGFVLIDKGDPRKAIADYNQAIDLNAKSWSAFFGLGRAYFALHEFPLAETALSSALTLQPNDAYLAIWREMTARRMNSQGTLASDTAQLDLAKWPGPIVQLLLGQITTEQAREKTVDPDPVKQRQQACELDFYSGELALAQNRPREARPLLRSAAGACPVAFLETPAAKIALGSLGTSPEAFPPLMDASIATVCNAALDPNKAGMMNGAPDAVAEAEARHLSVGDCRVALGLPRATFPMDVVTGAQDTLDTVQKFGASGASAGDVVALVPLVLALNKALAGNNETDVVSSTRALREKLSATPAYQTYLAAMTAEKQKQRDIALAEQQGTLAIVRSFATDYVARNMLSDQVPKLLSLITDLDAATASKDPARIAAQIEAAKAGFQAASIADAYNSFIAGKCGAAGQAGCSPALALNVPAQPTKPQLPASAPEPGARADAGPRIALVIGNSAYKNANRLLNPRNDSKAVAAKLKGLGFQVIEGEDLDKPAMDRTVQQFEDAVVGARVALLFYAGHGMQYEGHNYLIPIDAKLETASSINFETISVDQILAAMSDPGRIGIAMLDSCRDNPLARNFSRHLPRAFLVGNGMAATGTDAGGLLIAFATAPDQTASDGDGEHSPFTQALLDNMDAKSTEIGLMLKRVRQEVIHLTNNGQQPWESSSIGEFYLNP